MYMLEEVENFIVENEIDERAGDALRAEDSEVQRLVMERGSLSDTNNPSSVLMSRIRSAKGQLKSQGRAGQRQSRPSGISVVKVGC